MKIDKNQIGLNAGIVWQTLSDNSRWSYDALKEKTGLEDKELCAALGWLCREDKIEVEIDNDEFYVSLLVNVYIG